jgi:hypothetical protein
MSPCINTENWTYCRFEQGSFMALVTFGADPESVAQDSLEYYVTVLEGEEKEVFQQKFSKLNDACMFLNANYGDWTFHNQTVTKSGCGTCAAH